MPGWRLSRASAGVARSTMSCSTSSPPRRPVVCIAASCEEYRDEHEGRTSELISVRIPDAVCMTGLSRSRIYQLIASGDIEAAKVGRSTVILVTSLRSLVLANHKVSRRRR